MADQATPKSRLMGMFTPNKNTDSSSIQKVIERKDRLEQLEEKSADLEKSTEEHVELATKAKNQQWWRSLKWTIILAVLVLLIVIIIIIAVVVKSKKGGNNNNNSNSTNTPSPIPTATAVSHHNKAVNPHKTTHGKEELGRHKGSQQHSNGKVAEKKIKPESNSKATTNHHSKADKIRPEKVNSEKLELLGYLDQYV
ncbi:hypothetical protein HDU97_002320 [Phlyctochytrium planicorne]|nr:hypothetical protein HDU97_002320 [Phlyctochytrium planicorne]